jgi:hypothetical protein
MAQQFTSIYLHAMAVAKEMVYSLLALGGNMLSQAFFHAGERCLEMYIHAPVGHAGMVQRYALDAKRVVRITI